MRFREPSAKPFDTASPDSLRKRPGAKWPTRPAELVNARGETQPLDVLAGQRVAAFCGIGNPAGFRHTLAATGCELVAWREFPDHHAYTAADQSELGRDGAGCQCRA